LFSNPPSLSILCCFYTISRWCSWQICLQCSSKWWWLWWW